MKNRELKRLCIQKNVSLKKAMSQMDSTGLKILFVMDGNNKFMGTVTDGDFRRRYLSGKSMDLSVAGAYNRNSIKFPEKHDIEEVKRVMVENRLECVPVIDKKQKIVDALFWEDLFGNKYKRSGKVIDVPVVIVAGGKGTRLSPFTKILPKPLIPVHEKPVAEVIMDNFHECGCSRFYLLLGYKGLMVQSYFENTNNSYKPSYIYEKEPRGTVGALRLLPGDLPDGSFFVSNCDTIIKADYADIYDFHVKKGNDITIVGAMRQFVIPYGVLETKKGGSISKVIEKPEYNFVVNTGMYLLKKDLISLVPANGIFHFTDLLKKAKRKGAKISVYPISEKSWLDIGEFKTWEESISIMSEE